MSLMWFTNHVKCSWEWCHHNLKQDLMFFIEVLLGTENQARRGIYLKVQWRICQSVWSIYCLSISECNVMKSRKSASIQLISTYRLHEIYSTISLTPLGIVVWCESPLLIFFLNSKAILFSTKNKYLQARKRNKNVFNFNSKWTLKSWYCSAYYVNLMRYNNTR